MNIQKKVYIALFAVLYLIVAFVSFYHGVHYMSLANTTWMAVILSIAFEVGQAAVLFALLTSKENRGKIMPWLLMAMFTLVQILGNVYSSYKYVVENSMDLLKFFKEPVFIWTTIPDDQATVIVTYILGATLPLSALALTGMVTSFLHTDNNEPVKIDNESIKTIKDEKKAAEDLPNLKTDDVTPVDDVIVDEAPKEELITDTSPTPINEDLQGSQNLNEVVTDKELKKTHLIS